MSELTRKGRYLLRYQPKLEDDDSFYAWTVRLDQVVGVVFSGSPDGEACR